MCGEIAPFVSLGVQICTLYSSSEPHRAFDFALFKLEVDSLTSIAFK